MALEVERKFLDVDLDDLRNRLREQGAHCLGAHFEANTVFDTPEGDLFSSGRLLRLAPHWQAAPLPVSLVYPYARFYPARLRQFVEVMRAAMPGVIGGEPSD